MHPFRVTPEPTQPSPNPPQARTRRLSESFSNNDTQMVSHYAKKFKLDESNTQHLSEYTQCTSKERKIASHALNLRINFQLTGPVQYVGENLHPRLIKNIEAYCKFVVFAPLAQSYLAKTDILVLKMLAVQGLLPAVLKKDAALEGLIKAQICKELAGARHHVKATLGSSLDASKNIAELTKEITKSMDGTYVATVHHYGCFVLLRGWYRKEQEGAKQSGKGSKPGNKFWKTINKRLAAFKEKHNTPEAYGAEVALHLRFDISMYGAPSTPAGDADSMMHLQASIEQAAASGNADDLK
ncbi:hypothetical protein BOTBODRAFT_41863 [Botryobasidium botryosum FD-172 SS1]|uniref:Uncharacterized protein n=1 Tax=Botryobasidium botryosum (strain FD-172 SS1) TaxID=930990 RepID=A0A067MTE3_BOTB1|nr:hypothetical protein BOTBODRAFT_41863 [Botryobasidium botryosum FD-172 SS1]